MTALDHEDRQLVVVESASPATLFGTTDPQAIIKGASERATALAGVIRDKKLFVNINGRDHVRIEGWTLLGTLLGVFPVTAWTRQTADGWEARVEARTLAGALVGAAEAECSHNEAQWENRPSYALKSMAQTRATSKALRMPLGFVMSLAGYDPTPAEEIERENPTVTRGRGPARPVAPPRPQPVGPIEYLDDEPAQVIEGEARPVTTAGPGMLASPQQRAYIERLLSDVGLSYTDLHDQDALKTLPDWADLTVASVPLAVNWLLAEKKRQAGVLA